MSGAGVASVRGPLIAVLLAAAGLTGGAVAATSAGAGGSHQPAESSAVPARLAAAPQPFQPQISTRQASVAEELGPDIVTARLTPDGGRLLLQVHALTGYELPTPVPLVLPRASITGRCGVGCYDVSVAASAQTLHVEAVIGGTRYTALLPIRFEASGDRLAGTLLQHVDAAQEKLHSAVVYQTLRSSPTVPEVTLFEIQAPDRLAYQVSLSGRALSATIIIGTREWLHVAGGRRWQPTSYGSQPFSAAAYLDWWAASAGSPRLLDLFGSRANRIADVAALSEISGLGAIWYRLRLDVTHNRVLGLSMITVEHFMTQKWGQFDNGRAIQAPPAR